MVFSSFVFIFQFLPIFLVIYFMCPQKCKNLVILLGSLFFYYYGVKDHPLYFLLILLSILVNYVSARMLDRTEKRAVQKFWLLVGMFYNIGSLFLFKYTDFVFQNVNEVLSSVQSGTSLPYLNLILPVGISFYTFQISSYLIDVYRGEFPAERSIITLGTYLCLFPQLIAGPIVTYAEVRTQLKQRIHTLSKLEEGLKTFTIGLALKVLIANRVGNIWTQAAAIGYESISTPMAWLALVAYSLQIYFDFYGYSLMAQGLGKVMGFDFPDNFRNPYQSKTVSEFWRRWHITLGSWFREYVYIPLGGNRRHHFRNLLIVWFLTGLWHGASWNFILWGLLSFVLIVLEKKGLGKWMERLPVVGHCYMIVFILFSWLLFGITDLSNVGIYLTKLLPFLPQTGTVVFRADYVRHLTHCAAPLFAGLLCCTGIPRKIYDQKKNNLLTALVLVILFWLCVHSMYLGLDDPFLYYQF